MARICLIIALIGGLVSGAFAFLLNGKKKEWHDQYEVTTTKLNTTQKTLTTAQGDLKSTKETLEQTTNQLSEAKSRVDALTGELSKAQGRVTDLEQKVTQTEQKVTEAQTKLSDVQSRLGAESAAAQEAQTKLTGLETEKKILADDLAGEKARVKELQSYIDRSQTGEMPPGIVGKIVAINRNWNFVVLNVGMKQGVVENGEMIVYRNKVFVGKVRVVSTEANTAVADIIPASVQGQIQEGDEVMN
jgi:peptidoglycan hydrolase CwlO-like protein